MSDELEPHERRLLDGWTALDPPADFADRVLARQPQPRRWLPYSIAAAGCVAAAAMLIVVLRPTTEPAVEPLLAIAPPDAAPAVAPIADAGVVVDGAVFAKPEPYDVDIEVGQTATIHDPTGKPRINFYSAECRSGIQAEIDLDPTFRKRRASQGVFGVVIELGVGRWHYRARCMSGGMPAATPIASGTLTVTRDSGRPSPTGPIKADGGTYQRAMPVVFEKPLGGEQLHFSAPGPARIDLRSSVGASLIELTDLAEGTYAYWFTRGSMTMGTRSTLVVASAQIELDLPRDGDRATPALDVRGTVRPGWSVSFEGSQIPIDAQRRFAKLYQQRTNFTSAAVRFDHPQRGTHFYVRRLR